LCAFPDTKSLFYGEIISRCWAKQYTSIAELAVATAVLSTDKNDVSDDWQGGARTLSDEQLVQFREVCEGSSPPAVDLHTSPSLKWTTW
jgi:hypothetical protein